MRRLLLILPLCLIFAPSPQLDSAAPRAPVPEAEINPDDALPTAERFVELARTDPIAFLKASILRYQREVRGYQAVLYKQEFIGGTLHPFETIDVAFQDEPYGLVLRWRGLCIGRADRVLYVKGANGDKMLARPKNRAARMLVGDVVARDTDGADARAAGRYSLREFGLKKGSERTLAAWEAAQKRGNLRVEYLGIKPIADCNNRPCHVLKRTCNPPEEDGVVDVEVAFDAENWLQIANLLTASDGRRIGAYYFRDIVLNPRFGADQFERSALTRD